MVGKKNLRPQLLTLEQYERSWGHTGTLLWRNCLIVEVTDLPINLYDQKLICKVSNQNFISSNTNISTNKIKAFIDHIDLNT